MSKNTEAVLGRRTRYLILGLLFAVTGIGKIWLWTEGAANDFGLYLGIAMCSGAPLLQRTPAATEAMDLMMRNAFELGYRRYEWKCDSLNAASRRAAGRLGFTFEGVFRQALVYKVRSRDTAWYSILDSEWPELDRGFRAWLRAGNFDEAGRQGRTLAECREEADGRRDGVLAARLHELP